jgi:hypothetical protein
VGYDEHERFEGLSPPVTPQAQPVKP